ncbi:unnamed protein product [Caenorhabditis angaria]|uniref:vitamin-K-epoxide reductase (warfarin-sensitive) n=1 Tax=Caenorhabditis angaria TaxID=860376 RepID=A0A9P1IG28_9PELO|nr:unnamed protein product [Caenorhabditis angaria]
MRKFYIYANFLILFLGIFVSCYALYVEIRSESDPEYIAMCDLNQLVSCTKVMNSEYSTGFGIVKLIFGEDSSLNMSNAFYGVVGYFFLTIFQFFEILHPYFLTSISVKIGYLLNILSIYLFFILLHLQTLCIVCLTTYFVNAAYLFLAIRRNQINKNKSE